MDVKVRVKTEASKETVERLGTNFVIHVREPAKENRANERVRELLARELMVPLAAVRIVSGHHRPHKRLSIRGIMR